VVVIRASDRDLHRVVVIIQPDDDQYAVQLAINAWMITAARRKSRS
jgi:hypothetical protein